jgi:hypothetical protein
VERIPIRLHNLISGLGLPPGCITIQFHILVCIVLQVIHIQYILSWYNSSVKFIATVNHDHIKWRVEPGIASANTQLRNLYFTSSLLFPKFVQVISFTVFIAGPRLPFEDLGIEVTISRTTITKEKKQSISPYYYSSALAV